MPVHVGEMGPIKVNCLLWTGAVSRADAVGVPGRIDPSRPEFGPRWISYFDTGVDLSDVDAAALLELRDNFRPVIAALAAKGPFKTILVSNSRYNDPLLAMWRTLSATDAGYAYDPELVPDIGSAARAHDLGAADAEQLRSWIERQLGRTLASPR